MCVSGTVLCDRERSRGNQDRGKPIAYGSCGHRNNAGWQRPAQLEGAPGKLEYLAGTESGMAVWVNDIVPETAARRLREA